MKREKSRGVGWVGDSRPYYTASDSLPLTYQHDKAITTANYEFESIKGVSIPNFHKRKKAGELLPFTHWQQYSGFSEHQDGSIEWTKVDKIDPNVWSQGILPNGPNSPHLMTFRPAPPIVGVTGMQLAAAGHADYLKVQGRLVQQAMASIYSTGWDTLTFVAELRKTLGMFRGVLTRLVKNLRSGKIEDIWLEGRYGWRTLVYDINDINKAISELDTSRTRFAQRVGTNVAWQNDLSDTVSGWSDCDILISGTEVYQLSIRGTVVADIKPASFRFNPVTTTWELMTLSFVIDWVVNVGRFLEATSGMLVSSGWVAAGGIYLTRTAQQSGTLTGSSQYGWHTTASGTAGFSSVETLTLRHPTTIPSTPLIELNLDWLKVGDLVSLVLQALKRR